MVHQLIQVSELVKKIGDKMILRNLHLDIAAGDTVAVLGPNGAGKSTLLKILASLSKPTSGEVVIDGLPMAKNVNKVRALLGFLPHASLLYEHFSPLENLVFFAKLYGVKDAEKRAKELVRQVGLSFFLHESVKGFSRGMTQRIAIARAIVHEPSILLLDEPHTGLDQLAIGILNDVVLAHRAAGKTTLIVTHDFKQAAALCNRAVIIQGGKVVDDFSIEKALQSEEALVARYVDVVGGEVK